MNPVDVVCGELISLHIFVSCYRLHFSNFFSILVSHKSLPVNADSLIASAFAQYLQHQINSIELHIAPVFSCKNNNQLGARKLKRQIWVNNLFKHNFTFITKKNVLLRIAHWQKQN